MTEQMSIHEIIANAKGSGMTPASYAVDIGCGHMLASPALWGSVIDIDQSEDDEGISEAHNNVYIRGLCDDVLSRMSEAVSDCVQFPVQTTYLFGLGAVASVMTRNFSYEYKGGIKPVTLYIAAAQPPSTGKSGIHSYFSSPIAKNFSLLNKENAIKRSSVKADLDDVTSQQKKLNPSDITKREALDKRFIELNEELDLYPIYRHAVSDITSEALADLALEQGGYFSILGDEAEAINTMLGATYGSSDGKKNHGAFLKGWDNEMVDVVRIGRETKCGHVRGSICVLAQYDTIDTILNAGSSGRGVNERFLLMREPTMRGTRIHKMDFESVRYPLVCEYEGLIDNIFAAGEVKLTFSQEARQYIVDQLNRYEPALSPDGIFGHDMLAGFFGKMDKHVAKLASVIHTVEAFSLTGNKSTVISLESVQRAVIIFESLGKIYVSATDKAGYAGDHTEIACIVESLKRFRQKSKPFITVGALRDAVKNHKVMKGLPKLTNKIKDEYIPELESANYIAFDGKRIHINPRIND